MSFSVKEMLITACATNLLSTEQNLVAFLEAFAAAIGDRLINRLICEDFVFAMWKTLFHRLSSLGFPQKIHLPAVFVG